MIFTLLFSTIPDATLNLLDIYHTPISAVPQDPERIQYSNQLLRSSLQNTTNIDFIQGDILQTFEKFTGNIAISINPNATYATGKAMTQKSPLEESVTHSTNISKALLNNKITKFLKNPEIGHYWKYHNPIGDQEGLLVSGVALLKDTNKKFNAILVPAYDLNPAHYPGDIQDREYQSNLLKFNQNAGQNKVDLIFQIAYKSGADTLIIPPLGTGAFKNDPNIVARYFAESIRKYGGYFKNIIIADINPQSLSTFKNIINNELQFSPRKEKEYTSASPDPFSGMNFANTNNKSKIFVDTNFMTIDQSLKAMHINELETILNNIKHPNVKFLKLQQRPNMTDYHYMFHKEHYSTNDGHTWYTWQEGTASPDTRIIKDKLPFNTTSARIHERNDPNKWPPIITPK